MKQPSEAPALELQDVHAGYGETTVLRGVCLAVSPGGALAVLGPNGAGKTTLLRVASGLLTPSAGKVLLDGVEVTRRRPGERVGLGVCHIPDPRGIFPSLTVRDNLLLQAPKGTAAASIERAVEAFPRLGQRLAQTAGTLSGGEQQMLALARAYLQRPRVVLVDEVSMGLAPNLVDEIFEFLQRLAQRAVGLVVVEQFVHRALAMVDRVLVLSRGRVVLAAEAEAVDEVTIFDAYAGAGDSPGRKPSGENRRSVHV